MKFATVSKSLIMGAALLLASSAFAGTKADLTLMSPVTVNGTQLKPGDYKLQWEGAGPNVEVSIMKGKNVVTKIPAKIVDLKDKSEHNAAVVQKHSDGTNTLSSVRFEGKKFALDLGDSSDGTLGQGGK